MTKIILIENDQDFMFLANMFDRAIHKIKTEVSKFDLEQAERIIRIHDSIHSAEEDFSEESENNAEQNSVVQTKSSKARAPKMKLNLCPEHPYYGANRAPKHHCESCWNAFKDLNPLSYEKKRRDFDRKMAKESKTV